MYYTIYKITNQLDGKFYIGSHKTKNLNDNYLGSGKYLKRAIEKYGVDNFTKEVLFVFDNAKDMYNKEAEIVNEDFLATENTYNLKVGGFGGWDYLNDKSNFYNQTHTKEHGKMMSVVRVELLKSNTEFRKTTLNNMSTGMKRKYKSDVHFYKKQSEMLKKIWPGRKHKDETKQKMSLSAQGKQDGEKNSQFGSMWITNGTENKKIMKTDLIPKGWIRGRKMNGAVP